MNYAQHLKLQELHEGMVEWLNWDLGLIHRWRNNQVAYFGCLVILTVEELLS